MAGGRLCADWAGDGQIEYLLLGSGLGPAQVYGIVKQHEGEVDVTTKMGEGTTFILYLPALPVAEIQAPPEKMLALPQGGGETILVVEDDATTQEALMDSLETLNYRVLGAANGRQALAILEEHVGEVALVLSDLVMPQVDGAALLQAMNQRGLSVPVVMLTGHPMEAELKKLQAQGLGAWLLKPPSLEQLAEVIARTLQEDSPP